MQLVLDKKGEVSPSLALRCSLPTLAGPQTPAPQHPAYSLLPKKEKGVCRCLGNSSLSFAVGVGGQGAVAGFELNL